MPEIRVAFIGYNDSSWMGGINYLKNLLYSVKSLNDGKIETYIFFEKYADPSVIKAFEDYATCITMRYDNVLTFLFKVLTRISKRDLFLNYYLRKYKIDVLSHTLFNIRGVSCKTIGWIPDFQHLHLPEMFSANELKLRNANFREIILGSDLTIVSSNDALKDGLSFEKKGTGKIKLIHFVSQINSSVYFDDPEIRQRLINKFRIPERYFFLPNQFWKHKNHPVVFKAVSLLKNKGTTVNIVCSGNFKALENKEYIDSLFLLIKELNITENVIQLGVIDYSDVQLLMRHSVSVINPSYFEGWSSSIEECKSMGKNMIVSDLPVHKEQDPAEALFFNPDDENDLAEKMMQKLAMYSGGPDFNLEQEAKEKLPERTLEFARSYESLVSELLEK